MKNRTGLLLLLALLLAYVTLAQKTLGNTFYCLNNGVRTLKNSPQTLNEQAALIKKIGFDGLAGHNSVKNLKLRAELDKVDLKMPEVYFGMILSLH